MAKNDVSTLLADPAKYLRQHGQPSTVFSEIIKARPAVPRLDYERIEREREIASLLPQVVGHETR